MKVTINGQVIQEAVQQPIIPIASDPIPVTGSMGTTDIVSGANEHAFHFHYEPISPFDWMMGKIGEKIKEGTTEFALDFVTDFLSVLPIVLVFGFGVFILLRMFSKTLANWGLFGVILYSAFIVLIN